MVSHPSRRVSADTVTALSMELAEDVPPPPGVEALVGQHRARLAGRVAATEGAMDEAAGKGMLTRRFTRAAARARRDAETFERLVSEVPKGMRLVAVYHAPRAGEAAGDGLRDPVIREYVRSTRRLHRFLATHHAEELRALGVCDHAIGQLRVQREARNAQGRGYDIDADHVIERESAGRWAARRGVDPDDPGAGEKFLVNFFGNITLLRGKEHRAKNRLKHLQMPQKADRARGQWYLSYVTERGEGQSGFVALPQQAGEELPLRPLGPLQRLQHVVFRARQAGEALYRIREELKAETGRKRVDLAAAFNGAARGPAVTEQAEVLRCALREAARQAETSLAESSRELHLPRQRALFSRFRVMWRNRALRGLRRTAEDVAFLPEGAALRTAFAVIDGKVAATAEAVSRMPPPARRKKKRRPAP